MFIWIIYLLGAFALLKGIKHGYFIVWELCQKGYNWIDRYGENSWAVVTGATDGIGWEFCREIAKRGLNVVLLSRTESKLQNRCKELTSEFPNIKAHYIIADFSINTTAEFYKDIGKKLEDKDVSVLVNNVGLFATKIKNSPVDELRDALVVNSLAQCLMTKVLIEKLKSRDKKSAVINVGSMASKWCNPIQSPYHASKAIGGNFTIGEADNFKDKVDFLTCFPGYVTTAMVARRKKDFVTIDAQECAESFCRLVGLVNQSWGHPKHVLFCNYFAVLKWVFGWECAQKGIYILLRQVQRFQYKKRVIAGDRAGVERDLKKTMETQNTESALVRGDTVTQSMVDAVKKKVSGARSDDAITDFETSPCTESDMDGRLSSQKLVIQNEKMTDGIPEGGKTPYLKAQSEFGTREDSNGLKVPELDMKKAENCIDKLKVE
jgi:17beta-estradiol 17-dehydrogenase / very-long-chain 3-oxoacyl-CoA reductase